MATILSDKTTFGIDDEVAERQRRFGSVRASVFPEP